MIARGWFVAGLLVLCVSAYSQSKPRRTHVSISPGLDFTTLRGRDTNGTSVVFPAGNNFRLGLAFEVNIRSARWNLLVEPAYQRYTAFSPYYLKYGSLETALGLRRNFFFNAYNGVFVQAMGIADIPLRFDLQLAPGAVFSSNSFRANVAAGGGVALGRFTLEYRQHSNRRIRDDYGSFSFVYTKRSVIASFRIF